MAQQRKSINFAAIIIFLVLIAVSGGVLLAAGDFENPFSVFTQLLPRSEDAGEDRESRAFAAPSGERAEGGVGRGEQSDIQWSQIGSVLYNVWFMGAVAAFVMVIQVTISSLKHWRTTHQLRQS